MKFKRLIAAIAAAALLSGCAADNEAENDRGKNTSNAGNSNKTDSSSSTGTESSGNSGNESNIGGDIEQSIIDSLKNPFNKPGQDKVPEEERISLTKDEMMIPFSVAQQFELYYKGSCENVDIDFTSSIENIDQLNYIIRIMDMFVTEDEADSVETITHYDENTSWEDPYNAYTPETLEKNIRKYLLASFDINNLDYTKSNYWDEEKGIFGVKYGLPMYDFRQYILEYAYRTDNDYYFTVVPKSVSSINFSDLTDIFFDIPRKQFIVRKVKDTYVTIAFKYVDDRPDYMKKAGEFFKDNNLNSLKAVNTFNSFNDPGNRKYFAGVMNGDPGKRMYFGYYHYMYVGTGNTEIVFETYGTRGKNDKITFEYNSSGYMVMQGSSNEKSKSITDHFAGETYKYKFSSQTQYNEKGEEENRTTAESCALNNSEISKDKFDSAPITSYFSDDQSNNCIKDSALQIELNPDKITLSDYYDLCKVLFE